MNKSISFVLFVLLVVSGFADAPASQTKSGIQSKVGPLEESDLDDRGTYVIGRSAISYEARRPQNKPKIQCCKKIDTDVNGNTAVTEENEGRPKRRTSEKNSDSPGFRGDSLG